MRKSFRRAAENRHDLAAHIHAVVIGVAQFRRVHTKTRVNYLGAYGGVVPHPVASHDEIFLPGQFRLTHVAVHGDRRAFDIQAA